MIFRDRSDAGKRLAAALADEPLVSGAERVVTVAIPRGGLPVGIEVARALGGPLDVAVLRELRVPDDPDVPFGAIAADGHVDVDGEVVERLGLSEDEVSTEVERRRAAVERRLALYRQQVPPAALEGAVAVVVDDGIASGGTARQACALARRLGATTVVLGVPVAPAKAADSLADVTDRVIVLTIPDEYLAVGQAYQNFPRFEDEEMLALLADALSPREGA